MYFTKNEAGEFVEVTGKLYTTEEYTTLKTKNDEFRTNNTALLKSNETLSAFAKVLDGVQNLTPEALYQKIDDLATKKADGLVSDMKTKHVQTVEELNQKLNGTSTQLQKLLLGTEVQKAGVKHGVVQTAYDDVLRRAESVFVIKDGKVAFKEEKLDADGNPYSVDSWMADQSKEAPHLFAGSQGPSASRPAAVRAPVNGASDNRTAIDKMASGLAKTTSNGPKPLA